MVKLSGQDLTGCTDSGVAFGCGYDHPGVGALDGTGGGGQFMMKHLFEEFAGGFLHQLNQV